MIVRNGFVLDRNHLISLIQPDDLAFQLVAVRNFRGLPTTGAGGKHQKQEKSWPQIHLLRKFLVTLRNEIPIDDLQYRSQVIGTTILVLQVICVLPDIKSEKRRFAGIPRAVLIR